LLSGQPVPLSFIDIAKIEDKKENNKENDKFLSFFDVF